MTTCACEGVLVAKVTTELAASVPLRRHRIKVGKPQGEDGRNSGPYTSRREGTRSTEPQATAIQVGRYIFPVVSGPGHGYPDPLTQPRKR